MGLGEKIVAEILFDWGGFISNFLLPSSLAVLFGGIIGFQREKTDRPAGLRTHSLVCLGSTVFTLVSYLGFLSFSSTDYSRVAAGVVTGIGFIGAGAIFRRGPLVKGVTTAASIWMVAAIGMALGTKLYYLALLVTVFGYIILTVVKYFEDRFVSHPTFSIKLTADDKITDFNQIDKILEKSAIIRNRICRTGEKEKTFDILINAQSRDPSFSIKAARELKEIKYIQNIEISQF
ncbi:MAG: MgtC/SapB family protein [Actinomycetota bacterium]